MEALQDLIFKLCLLRADRWQAFGLYFVFCGSPEKEDEEKPQLRYHESQSYKNDTWRINTVF